MIAAEFRLPVEAHELWVVELRLGGALLSSGMLAIDRGGELLLPLAELAALFELAIEVDPDQARARGFVLHPARRFDLDLAVPALRIEDRERDLAGARILIWSEEIYVDAHTLSRWLPVDLDVSARQLRVNAHSREPLPVEKRLARERLHRRLGHRQGEAGGLARADGYRWWSAPSFDANFRSRVTRPDLGGGHDWQSLYDVALAGDLAKLQTELLASGVDDDAFRLRLRAGRIDPEGRMGGSLRLREFSLGDVHTPALGQLSSGRSGRGFQISSFPVNHLNELGQLTLEGDLRPGYQVELYRGEILLDFQSADEGLRYRFEEIPTVPGLNELRLVFHGPRGEQREELRRFWSDGGLAEAGENRFRITVNQHDQDTLLLGDIGGDDRVRGDPRAVGEFEHGFSDSLTLALGAASIPLLEGQHHYGSLALRSEIDGHLLRFETLGNHRGGVGAGAGWQTRLGRHSLGLTHHEFSSFLSERTRDIGGRRLRGRTQASLDGNLRLRRQPVAYRVAAGHSRLTGGDIDFDGLLRLSTWLRPVFLTHNLRARLDRDLDLEQRTVSGDMLASFRRGPYGLRGRFLYGVVPGKLVSLSMTGEWSPRDLATTRLGLAHDFGKRTALLASISRRLGAVVISADVTVDESGLASAGVGFSVGAVPDPFAGRPRLQEPGATRTGTIAARTYLDRNANGRFDSSDQALPDIGFVASGARELRTDSEGTALITRLPPHAPLQVAVDAYTVRDPHWLLPEEPERVVLRPGAPITLEFPIVPVGEIDGWVMRDLEGSDRALAGVTVELFDETGEATASVRSEIDGFYLFQEVLPGRYRIRIDPDQVRRLGLRAPEALEVEIPEGGAVRSDQSFLLRSPCDGSKSRPHAC